MEKKTIGNWIATLRRANGMTQKELAERLHVSDKTVSRWECDEGTPDLSLIPVMAEIFGVSCDELLRGERKSPEERSETTADGGISVKTEKQRKRLLKSAMAQYKMRTWIAIGISATGFLVALICNFVFLRALLGALLGLGFFAAGAICQMLFVNRAFFSVDEEEIAALPECSVFKYTVVRMAERSVGISVGMFGFTSPLFLADAYTGLDSDNLWLFVVGMVLFLAVYALILWGLHAHWLKSGVITLENKKSSAFWRRHALQKKCGIVLASLLLATFVVQWGMNTFFGATVIADRMVFEDYDSFVAFMEMEQEVSASTAPSPDAPANTITILPDSETVNDEGNEYPVMSVFDANGEVLTEYTWRNQTVWQIDYAETEDRLPIRVTTQEELITARRTVEGRNLLFLYLYVLEILCVTVAYIVKRSR